MILFSVPKSFTDPHVNIIQRNAIGSWIQEGFDVILMGDDDGVADAAAEYGVRHTGGLQRNLYKGTPFVNEVFTLAARETDADVLCYMNADIIVMPGFIDVANRVQMQFPRFLMVGRRWDLSVTQEIEFDETWAQELDADRLQRGKLHQHFGMDYFCFTRDGAWPAMPRFLLGRMSWDNWLLWDMKERGIPVLNCTSVINIIHQEHARNYKSDPRDPEIMYNRSLFGNAPVLGTDNATYTVEAGDDKNN